MKKTIKLANELQSDSIVDGKGLRMVIWTQGCTHNCPGCQNPQTHDFNGGFDKDMNELLEEIKGLSAYHDGITLSGGDPFFQPKECTYLAENCRDTGLNVWAYTGFLYDDIIKNPTMLDLLRQCDVLVDGRFEIDKKSLNIPFRGSLSQRLIDVQKSLKENKVIELEL